VSVVVDGSGGMGALPGIASAREDGVAAAAACAPPGERLAAARPVPGAYGCGLAGAVTCLVGWVWAIQHLLALLKSKRMISTHFGLTASDLTQLGGYIAGIRLFVRIGIGTGKTITVHVKLSDNAEEVKRIIYEKVGIHPDDCYLIFAGHFLDNKCTLGMCQIHQDSTLWCELRLRGGGYSDEDQEAGTSITGARAQLSFYRGSKV
jgi:hypothetical protein